MNYTPEQKAKWDEVIRLIEKSMDKPIEKIQFDTWLRPLKLYAFTSDTIIILGDDAFKLQHVRSRYGTVIYSTVKVIFNRTYELDFRLESEIAALEAQLQTTTLNPKYTFKNFIVGKSNNFAFAASLAVAEAPSEVYNPLFLYGGVGLGKTHLMNAVGNFIREENPTANVLLMTSETLTNELIEAISRRNTSDLRAKMRNVDVLMVDDIQFLSRSRTAQEEFFHTFNDLHAKHKQVIISSDRPPSEIPEIEERLRSRFAWGLIVDIQKPDYETRVAILTSTAEEAGLVVPDDVLDYIAQNVKSNIRELEGCLNSLAAHNSIYGGGISLEVARAALSDRVSAQASRDVTVELIIEIVAQQYGIAPEDITGKKRNREIAVPRQIAMYISREMTSLSTTNIGVAFGGRDHTTVMHGCDKIAEAIRTDFSLKKRVDELKGLIRNN